MQHLLLALFALICSVSSQTYEEVATSLGYNTLVSLLTQEGLNGTLTADGTTLLAPSDAAFAALIASGAPFVVNDTLAYHYLPEEAILSNYTNGTAGSYTALSLGFNSELRLVFLNFEDGNLWANGNLVNETAKDVPVQDGTAVFQGIEKVLLVPTQPLDALINGTTDGVVDFFLRGDPLSSRDFTFTVFAPSAAAISALPTCFNASSNPEAFTLLLNYHILGGFNQKCLDGDSAPCSLAANKRQVQGLNAGRTYYSSLLVYRLTNSNGTTTLEHSTDDAYQINGTIEGDLVITLVGDSVFVNGIPIVSVDNQATNGVVHFIDGVLMPASLDIRDFGCTRIGFLSADFPNVTENVVANGLVDALSAGELTIFAPNNFPGGADNETLLYHVLAGLQTTDSWTDNNLVPTQATGNKPVIINKKGANTYVNGIMITSANIDLVDTIYHVIDTPLDVPAGTLVEIAVSANFSEAVRLLTLANLTGALNDIPVKTIFLPTNQAFQALPRGILTALEQERNRDQLISILTYHVVVGANFPSFIQSGNLVTLNEESVTIATTPAITVNGVATQGSVVGFDGVAYIINQVLLPDSFNPSTNVVASLAFCLLALFFAGF